MNEKEISTFINLLKDRFTSNQHRHKTTSWIDVENKLLNDSKKLQVIIKMEQTGGEPDVILLDNAVVYCDCATETPKERRSLCYDNQALNERKENKPNGSALQLANEIGITLLNEQQYRYLQTIEKLDLKTSSWINTPDEIRSLGGALFGDCRYNTTFIYHNGAQSYYAARGFRGYVTL